MATERMSDEERAAARRAAAAPVSPLDAPTVVGWDHPAAQAAPLAADDKWAHVAALMEAEHRAGVALRRRMRRNAIAVAVALLVLALVLAARFFAR